MQSGRRRCGGIKTMSYLKQSKRCKNAGDLRKGSSKASSSNFHLSCKLEMPGPQRK